ncbi:hypothetical protein ElyMa_001881900 [Elysia marginata]|uniref:Uncharacterized protein n=1 Tax=Elysia marginata TaxID=1093978 RepID=A0AAV4EQA1_9GAST|nr:hypothetical protein ElyMa_001881900 [Elysia marginata]
MARRHCEDDGKYVDQRSERQRRVETWCGGPYPAVDGRSLNHQSSSSNCKNARNKTECKDISFHMFPEDVELPIIEVWMLSLACPESFNLTLKV